ncbi:lipoyl(octanoyl) transferase LipB [Aliikangiella sp. IMCC44653]
MDNEKLDLSQIFVVKNLGRCDYVDVWQAMQSYTGNRDDQSRDQIWLVEHDPVFTQGQAGKPEHILAAGDIPIVQVDRGGQVTYHGPGQLVVYFLLDLRRKKLGVRQLVTAIENSVVDLLAQYAISAAPKADAPGVYIEGKKVCSLGLRIRKGCSFHGLALNVAMDTEPFRRINPCGYAGMQVTQVSENGGPSDIQQVANDLIDAIMHNLNYQHYELFKES